MPKEGKRNLKNLFEINCITIIKSGKCSQPILCSECCHIKNKNGYEHDCSVSGIKNMAITHLAKIGKAHIIFEELL
jgi:hypothetical protein